MKQNTGAVLSLLVVVVIVLVLNPTVQALSSPSRSAVDSSRRSVLSSLVGGTALIAGSKQQPSLAAEIETEIEEQESFAAIAAKASQITKAIQQEEATGEVLQTTKKVGGNIDTRTIYDFSLPVAGQIVPIKDLVRQEYTGEDVRGKVKAILVVNIKQDDPIARKDIPELISLAAKYGRTGEFVVICTPTDQGYYEADTSALIRLKLESEYGYGINPAAVLTDKVNLLGTGAHPFWRWIEGSCRTPAGLGRIEGNFEKFLVDGTTGLPLRRYPRKYLPYDIRDDIEAVLADKPLPPAGANFKEEWRSAARDAERDTYRFQKGLNVFDQME
eukprot:CAMPEP_0202449044 /NCGR_PEP_ID=MMETSP1360-20130828/7820_1 /ASSEMBLY_ACC=CAM_ASM_000848 /TAXON_ID=515479 /ORGANISM="Licmophora paradoxa, Strain CCMP2313" /LENGTH=329 /DNA_ID=CAMNT_0049066853 /DNA_START=1 /DNA_END=990 /DNA_ORIENTATION=-